MIITRTFIYFLLIILISCQNRNINQNFTSKPAYIIGGTRGKINDYRAVARLMSFTDRGTMFCTGLLINQITVITAAHCVDQFIDRKTGKHIKDVETAITFGTGYIKEKSPIFKIANAIVHPEYSASDINSETDVAILTLDRAVSKSIATPIPMISDKEMKNIKVGQKVTAIGFGVTPQTLGSKHLLKTKIAEIDGNFIRIGSIGKSLNSGDSGGPIIIELPSGELRTIATATYVGGKPDLSNSSTIVTKITQIKKLQEGIRLEKMADTAMKNKNFIEALSLLTYAEKLYFNLTATQKRAHICIFFNSSKCQNVNSRLHFLKAHFADQNRDYKTALKEYSLSSEPIAQYKIALIYFVNNDLKASYDYINKYIIEEINSKDFQTESLRIRATLLLRFNVIEAAISDLIQFIKLSPKDESGRILLAKLYQKDGHNDKALDLIEEHLIIFPQSIKALKIKTKLLANQKNSGELSDLIKHINKLEITDLMEKIITDRYYSSFKKMKKHTLELQKIMPKNHKDYHKIFYYLGVYYFSTGEYDKALDQTNNGLTEKPNDIDLLNMEGMAHIFIGHFDNGTKILRQVIDINPGHPRAIENLTTQLANRGMNEEVIEITSKKIAINPTAQDYAIRSMSYDALGMYDKAISDLEKLVAIKPSNPEPYFLLVDANFSAGNYEKVIKLSTDLIRFPNDMFNKQMIDYRNKAIQALLREENY